MRKVIIRYQSYTAPGISTSTLPQHIMDFACNAHANRESNFHQYLYLSCIHVCPSVSRALHHEDHEVLHNRVDRVITDLIALDTKHRRRIQKQKEKADLCNIEIIQELTTFLQLNHETSTMSSPPSAHDILLCLHTPTHGMYHSNHPTNTTPRDFEVPKIRKL